MLKPLSGDYNLTRLADRYGSDKGTVAGDPHRYTLVYDMILGPRRAEISRMIEIGLLRNGPEVGADADRQTGDLPSVRMWLDYFPEAVVHGFDISDFSFFQHDRFVFTRGDSGSAEDLARIAPGETFDFIIDDGSHASFHQQLAFTCLFPRLNPGGIYIIEDLQWQSPFYEDVLPHTFKTADMIRHWLKTESFPTPIAPQLAGLPALASDVSIALLYDQPFIPDQIVKAAILHKKY